jgi:hypothetical protein
MFDPDWGRADAATAAYWKERTAAFHGIVTWSPTIDPEHLKLLSQEIMLGAGVHLVFHAWAAAPIVEEGRVTGAVFESKEGRLAIRAGVPQCQSRIGTVIWRRRHKHEKTRLMIWRVLPLGCWVRRRARW